MKPGSWDHWLLTVIEQHEQQGCGQRVSFVCKKVESDTGLGRVLIGIICEHCWHSTIAKFAVDRLTKMTALTHSEGDEAHTPFQKLLVLSGHLAHEDIRGEAEIRTRGFLYHWRSALTREPDVDKYVSFEQMFEAINETIKGEFFNQAPLTSGSLGPQISCRSDGLTFKLGPQR